MKKTVLVSLFLGATIAGSAAIDVSPANAGGRYYRHFRHRPFHGNASNVGFPRPPKPHPQPPHKPNPPGGYHPPVVVKPHPKPVYGYVPHSNSWYSSGSKWKAIRKNSYWWRR
jgi:hypothetical protein